PVANCSASWTFPMTRSCSVVSKSTRNSSTATSCSTRVPRVVTRQVTDEKVVAAGSHGEMVGLVVVVAVMLVVVEVVEVGERAGGRKGDHEPWPQRGVRRVVRRHERPLVSRRTQRLGVLPDDEIELPAARCDRILAQGLQIREHERPGSCGWGEGGPRLRVDV